MAETLGSLLVAIAAALSAAGFGEPRRHARRLITSALAISQAELFGDPDRALNRQQSDRIRAMLGRIAEGEPLSRILGRREFWGLEFRLSDETLDPRPDTETVIEAILKRKPGRQAPLRILDLGTGTGCLLLALLSEYPQANGIGVDIAEAAVQTAIDNAADLGLGPKASFFVGDWAAAISGRFDVIVVNPPYIASGELALLPREVARYDPRRALDGGEDGLSAYREIAAELPMLLAPDGVFASEVAIHQARKVAAIMKAAGLVLDGIEKDLAGIPRCVTARPGRPKAKNGWNVWRSRLG